MKPEVSNADVYCAVRSCKAANCDSRRSTVLRCSLHTTFLAFEQFFSERSNSQRRTNVHCTGQLRTIGHWQQLICNWMNRASGRSDYGG